MVLLVLLRFRSRCIRWGRWGGMWVAVVRTVRGVESGAGRGRTRLRLLRYCDVVVSIRLCLWFIVGSWWFLCL